MIDRPEITNTQNSKFIERICYIVDAVYEEELGTGKEPVFKNRVNVVLRDDKSGVLFLMPFEEEHLRLISGIEEPLSSKEMVDMAEFLRGWDTPVRIQMPATHKSNTLTPEMALLNSKKTENTPQPSEEVIDLEEIDENDPSLGETVCAATFDRFALNTTQE